MARALPKQASGLFSYFTRHPTVANLLLVVLLAAGLLAIPNMRAQFFPDVVSDNIRVAMAWEGAGAEDVDAAIVQLMEPALLDVEGVASTEATSREGAMSIRIEFDPGWDMSRAMDDVQIAVDGVTNLPESADDPAVIRGTWRDRVTDLVITGPVSVEQLGRYADELIVRLFAEGVTRTTIRGLAAPQTVVEVPSQNLIAYDVTMAEIAGSIAAEVNTDPAGDVGSAGMRVRTGVEKRSAADLEGIVLRSQQDGSKLTIGDVAQVRVEGADRLRSYFVGDHQAISIRIDRSDKGDAIGIQQIVEEVTDEFQSTLPQEVSASLIRTRAEAITGRLDILLDNALSGLALVLVLLFLFLNTRTAFWVAVGIPTALLSAIALMYAAGLTINMISLFGLIITLGIVVDDAIVVGEHADWRARHGHDPYSAAEGAASRMALPVFSATLTTIIAFFGLIAIGGRFGDLIADIPFTVVVVLIASLVECFLILPNHMAHALKHAGQERWYDAPSRVVNRGFRAFRDRAFRPFMGWVIRGRYVVLACAVVLLASQAALLIEGDVRWRFFNAPERNSVTGNFAMAPGATREDSLAQMRLFQEATEALGKEYEEKYGTNPLDYVMAEVGGNAGRGLSGADTKDPDQLGGISIELIDRDARPYSSFAFVADLQDRVARHPLVETISFRGWRSGPGGDALDVQFYGASSEVLKAAAEDLKEAVAQFPEVSAVEDNLSYDKEELILEMTPQGRALGFEIDGLGRVLRHRLGGIEAATYPDGPRSATIRVELPQGELTADFLERMILRSPAGEYVPLADLVSVQSRVGFSTVRRENGIRLVSVTGDISEDDADRAAEIVETLEQDILPTIAESRQVDYRIAGLAEQEDEFLNDARTGLTLVLLGIYLVLSWVFASWTRPLVVMAIIPFGLVGTIYGHNLWNVPMSMFTVVGLLGMTGIIINDSIVLVTQIDGYAAERGLVPSIIDGVSDRLRAVFLTTATTVLGLAPLLYEQSAQAEFLKPTVITLVYGLGFGMLLVLLVVPALVAVQRDVAELIQALRRGLRFRDPLVRMGLMVSVAAMLMWFGLTLGWVFANGGLPAWMPVFTTGDTPAKLEALALFMIGSLAIAMLSFVAIAGWKNRGRAGAKT